MKPGDKVVCVNPQTGIVKDEIYTVKKIKTSECGCVSIDVGVDLLDGKVGTVCSLHRVMVDFSEIHWYHIWRFRLVDYSYGENICEEIEKQIEHEYVRGY